MKTRVCLKYFVNDCSLSAAVTVNESIILLKLLQIEVGV